MALRHGTHIPTTWETWSDPFIWNSEAPRSSEHLTGCRNLGRSL